MSGAAASSTTTESTRLHQQEFLRRLRRNLEKVTDNYSVVLRAARVSADDDAASSEERLMLQVYSANMVHACESVLQMIQELRLSILLLDADQVNCASEAAASSARVEGASSATAQLALDRQTEEVLRAAVATVASRIDGGRTEGGGVGRDEEDQVVIMDMEERTAAAATMLLG